MDESTIARLQSSFNLLAPRAAELADRFYAHLFVKNPGLRSMFPRDMTEQKTKLVASLVLVVKNLSAPENLRGPLMELGRRHAGYGAQSDHYPVVRDTLVAVMSDMAGAAWNAQLTEDWTAALEFVASVMLEGHKQAVCV